MENNVKAERGLDAGSASSQPTVLVQQHAGSKSDQSVSWKSTPARYQFGTISVTVAAPTANMQEEVEAED